MAWNALSSAGMEMTMSIKETFETVDELKGKLDSFRPFNQDELERLQQEFVIENTYDSNAIEGNTLTLRETAMIIQEGITIGEKSIKEHLDLIGHKDAFEYILKFADMHEPLSERTIKQIHSLVLINNAMNRGIWRRIPVHITGALHTPPQPYLIQPQMERLLIDYEKLRKEKHIIEAVAELHLCFEGIHPFLDGNGRTGRLILNFELIKAGFLPINIKYTDRRKYYDCFDDYYGDSHSLDRMIGLIAQYEEYELKKYLDIVKQIK
jgi:Fic family protein